MPVICRFRLSRQSRNGQDLDEFNRLAIKYKVKVALHCHPKPASHYWHPDSTIKAMQGRSHIGAWPDLGHWARNGVNVVEGLKKMKGKLWGMHYQGYPGV